MRVQQVQLVAAFKSAGKQTPVSDTAVSAKQLAAVPMQEMHTDSFVSGAWSNPASLCSTCCS